MSDFVIRRLAELYASDADMKAEVDRALGVYHVPRCAPSTCELCDARRQKEGCTCPDGAAMENDPDDPDAHYFTCGLNRHWRTT